MQGAQEESKAKRYPWYSLDPRSLRRSRLIWIVLLGLIFWEFQFAPGWEFLWRHAVPTTIMRAVYARGLPKEALRWHEARRIRVYQLPSLREGRDEEAAAVLRALVEELGLNFTVEAQPMPEDMVAGYERCLTQQKVFGEETSGLDLDRFADEVVALRKGELRGDVVIVDAQFGEWAGGCASTFTGLAVLSSDALSEQIIRHEGCHLLGYAMHDMLPLFVFGYGWEGWPWERDSLMIGLSGNREMLGRTRGAITAYWRGMQARTGGEYVR